MTATGSLIGHYYLDEFPEDNWDVCAMELRVFPKNGGKGVMELRDY